MASATSPYCARCGVHLWRGAYPHFCDAPVLHLTGEEARAHHKARHFSKASPDRYWKKREVAPGVVRCPPIEREAMRG